MSRGPLYWLTLAAVCIVRYRQINGELVLIKTYVQTLLLHTRIFIVWWWCHTLEWFIRFHLSHYSIEWLNKKVSFERANRTMGDPVLWEIPEIQIIQRLIFSKWMWLNSCIVLDNLGIYYIILQLNPLSINILISRLTRLTFMCIHFHLLVFVCYSAFANGNISPVYHVEKLSEWM